MNKCYPQVRNPEGSFMEVGMVYLEIANMLRKALSSEDIVKYLPLILEAVTLATSDENERLSPESAMKIQELIERVRNGA